MKRRRLVALAIVTVGLVGFVFLDPNCLVAGWVRGESFYKGRPTTSWSRELGQWHDLWQDVMRQGMS